MEEQHLHVQWDFIMREFAGSITIPFNPKTRSMTDPALEIIKKKADEAFNKNNYVVALSLYAFLSNIDPDNGVYHLNMSLTHLRLQRWADASSEATKALELCNLTVHRAKAYFRRCQARRELHDEDRGLDDLEAFLSIGGEPEIALVEAYKLKHAHDSRASARDSRASTSEPVPDSVDELADLLSERLKFADSGPKLAYEIRPTKDKGLGAFAAKPLRRGDFILEETPIFRIDSESDYITSRSLAAKFEQLSPTDLSRCLSLSNVWHSEIDVFEGIYNTNVFGQSMLLEVSRFNHSCSPNARYIYHEPSKKERVVALTDIAEGEEICVSYLQSRDVYARPRSERQQVLSSRYRFCCQCPACDDANFETNDRRRREIRKIWVSLPSTAMGGRKALLAIVRTIVLMKEDGYFADAGELAVDAAAICAGHSDWESCEYWAKFAYENRVAEFGDDHPLAISALQPLQNPRNRKYHPQASMFPRKSFKDIRLPQNL
ncbi:hypothetical protein EV361DRAFT_662118 [Lentinula raphanica]|nr:hypothetical protein EV361DRAFT_662118 [Lentinula raphanica]